MLATAQKLAGLPHVDAVMHYLASPPRKPCLFAGPLEQDGRPDARAHQRCRARIHDARPIADSLSLDHEGFRLVRHASATRSFWSAADLERIYYPEIESLVASATGACWAFVLGHTVRRRVYGLPDHTSGAPRQPPMHVHVDFTERSAVRRLQDVAGLAARAALRRRFAIVSAWRPIRGPLHDAPLAMCDATSVAAADLVAVDVVKPGRIGEFFGVLASPQHRWMYFPGMRPDELLLFKSYDSAGDGIARFVPHAAFEDPSAPADRLIQESIEVKAVAVFGA